MDKLLGFVLQQPLDQDCIDMDCQDDCEKISRLAERVAAGEKLEDLAPLFADHVRNWRDCREEFTALVAMVRAELASRNPPSD
jgi:hypothetical protein